MTTHPKIKSDIQNLVRDSPKISLFTVDATSIGGSTYHFTVETDGGSAVVFNGVTYLPLPVTFTGMELTGEGHLPRPRMKVSNVSKTFLGLISASGGGLGAKVIRKRTLAKYLDNKPDADPTAMYAEDTFYIEQQVERSKHHIEWEIVSPLDFGERTLPKNQVIGYCQRRYRVYTSGAFDYSKSNCRYAGTNYFTFDGLVTTAENDVCGKKLTDCEKRFPGGNVQLPFRGFPGIGQIARAYR